MLKNCDSECEVRISENFMIEVITSKVKHFYMPELVKSQIYFPYILEFRSDKKVITDLVSFCNMSSTSGVWAFDIEFAFILFVFRFLVIFEWFDVQRLL